MEKNAEEQMEKSAGAEEQMEKNAKEQIEKGLLKTPGELYDYLYKKTQAKKNDAKPKRNLSLQNPANTLNVIRSNSLLNQAHMLEVKQMGTSKYWQILVTDDDPDAHNAYITEDLYRVVQPKSEHDLQGLFVATLRYDANHHADRTVSFEAMTQ